MRPAWLLVAALAACTDPPTTGFPPLDPWMPVLGIEGDPRIAGIRALASPPRAYDPTIQGLPRWDPFDVALPERLEAIRVILAPGEGQTWSERRELAWTLRSRLGTGTGAPDLEVLAPGIPSGAYAHIGPGGQLEVAESIGRALHPPPERRKAEVVNLEVIRVNRGFKDPSAPMELRVGGQVRNLATVSVEGVRVRVRRLLEPVAAPGGLDTFDIPVAGSLASGESRPFAWRQPLPEGSQVSPTDVFVAQVALGGQEVPLFDTLAYAHDLAFAEVRKSVLEPAGLVPLVDQWPAPGARVTGLPVHKALCASEAFMELTLPEQEAVLSRVFAGLRIHATTLGEGFSDIRIFLPSPTDPRVCNRDAGVLTAGGAWIPWLIHDGMKVGRDG